MSSILAASSEPRLNIRRPFQLSALATLSARGSKEVEARFLLVDCYRVRRRAAVPLPLLAVPKFPSKVGVIEQYPWLLFGMWRLESRWLSLAALAEQEPGGKAAQILERDLSGLFRWNVGELAEHALPCSHLLRTLTYLIDFFGVEQTGIAEFLGALISAQKEGIEMRRQTIEREKLTGGTWPRPYYNIHCILLFALALAARRIDHQMRSDIEGLAEETLAMLADARRQGWTEGWSYDAFIQDFLADWLLAFPSFARPDVYSAFRPSLLEPFQICCPGKDFNPPILADSECPMMYFHWSAAVKWYALSGDKALLGHLRLAKLEEVSSDALCWWPEQAAAAPEAPHPMATPSAVVLRKGTKENGIVITLGAARCQNGHLHADRGHLCLGADGHWIVQDPGYRQYLRTSEHEFATGAKAHNAPVIEGFGQNLEGVRVLPLEWPAPIIVEAESRQTARLELAGFYPLELGLVRVARRVALEDAVVVEDLVEGERPAYLVSYYWHFHPEAYLGAEGGKLLIVIDGNVWMMQCNLKPITLDDVSRLRGSRGQQTLGVEILVAKGNSVKWEFRRI